MKVSNLSTTVIFQKKNELCVNLINRIVWRNASAPLHNAGIDKGPYMRYEIS